MNASARGGYARGAAPARPGDLTQRVQRENQRKAEAAKRVQENGDPYETGFAAGWNRGYDAGFDGGYEVALKQLRDAGIDTDAVLALDDDDADDAEA